MMGLVSAAGRTIQRAPLTLAAAILLLGLALGISFDSIAARLFGTWVEGDSVAEFRTLTLSLLAVAAAALTLPVLRSGRAARLAQEEELADMTRRLDLAMAASRIGFWDVDLASDALRWDEQARRLFGVAERAGYFSEADWLAAVHPDDRARALTAAHAAVASGGRFVSDYRVVWPDGRIRHLRDMATCYRGRDGRARLAGLVWDVTKDKEREAELELRRREAEAATRAKSNFLAAMSHEIRTPLAGVIGMLDLLIEEALPPRPAERARIAWASAHGLLQLLNDVLDVSKLEAGAVRLLPAPIDPRQVVREVVDLMAARAEQKGLALSHAVADAVPAAVLGDALRLRQVLTNIVSNAIAFTPRGEVRVALGYRVTPEGPVLDFAVSDTGIGIAPADQERIFERFVQADASPSRPSAGTGLGLAIARQLVELMGGRISVESEEGAGSTFRFTVAARPAVLAEAERPAPRHVPTAAPLNVLVAEDNATNQYLIEALLAPLGHRVVIVRNGREAVEAVTGGGFDVVLMDVQMPEMDGLAASRAIRGLPGPERDVPIIGLTAAAAGEPARYAAAGMTDQLAKPIDVNALHGVLARLGAPQARLRPGGD